MRGIRVLPIVGIMLMAGCRYECPVTEKHSIKVDPALLGAWEYIPSGGEAAEQQRMLVLKFSETEYLIHLPGSSLTYFRGYPIKIGDVSCVQLQLIGSAAGPLDKGEKSLFQVVTCRMEGGELEVRVLNPKLAGGELRDSKALAEAIKKNIKSAELFEDPMRFKRKLGPATK